MSLKRLKTLFAAACGAIFACVPAATMAASVTTWPQQTNLVLSGSGITLQIDAASKADSLSVAATSFTVIVASGDTFTVRYPGPSYGTMTNDGSIDSCNLVSSDNVAVVSGPKTVTFTPTTSTCTPVVTSSVGMGVAPSSIHLSTPNGGEVLPVGYVYRVYWTYTGSQLQGVRLSLSIDGGSSWSAIGSTIDHTQGFTDWTVPTYANDTAAKLRVQLIGNGGSVLATDQSDGVFYIDAPVPAVIAPPTTVSPSPDESERNMEAYDAAATIAGDKALSDAGTPLAAFCKEHELIKLPDDGKTSTQLDSAVYYCGIDGKRYAFPNAKTYATWYGDFSKVKTISARDMAALPLGGLVTYRPGTRLVKIQSDPKTYAVGVGGLLRHVPDEATAAALFGPAWSALVDDIDVGFFVNYRVGEVMRSSR